MMRNALGRVCYLSLMRYSARSVYCRHSLRRHQNNTRSHKADAETTAIGGNPSGTASVKRVCPVCVTYFGCKVCGPICNCFCTNLDTNANHQRYTRTSRHPGHESAQERTIVKKYIIMWHEWVSVVFATPGPPRRFPDIHLKIE